MNQHIPVTFRMDRTEENGQAEVTAVFLSRTTHPTNEPSNRMCYVHAGQHGGCSLDWAREKTRPATPDEYTPLLREVRAIYGDTLRICADIDSER